MVTRPPYDEHAHRLVTWARLYAQRNWPVFPLAAGTKVPALSRRLGGRGCLDATVDPDVVDRMWRRFPGANVGVATGGAAGVAVLDADKSTGGKESLQRLVAEHGPLPPAPFARTTSGGRHYFFNAPPGGIANSASRLGPGLDVRGTGGYVVVYPSSTPAGAYEWLNDWRTDLSDWPEWLIPPKIEPTPIRRPDVVAGLTGSRVLDGLTRSVEEAPTGARNDRLFWAGCCLAEHVATGRVSLDEGTAILLAAAARAGLTDTEAHRTLNSALRKVGVAA